MIWVHSGAHNSNTSGAATCVQSGDSTGHARPKRDDLAMTFRLQLKLPTAGRLPIRISRQISAVVSNAEPGFQRP